MARKIHAKVPLVSRNLGRRGMLNHLASFDAHPDRDQQRGRFASHDRVAMCLLPRELASALPVRRELSIARNRRRLKFAFGLVILWWFWGRFFV